MYYLSHCWQLCCSTLQSSLVVTHSFIQNQNIQQTSCSLPSGARCGIYFCGWKPSFWKTRTCSYCINSLALGEFRWTFWKVIRRLILVINGLGVSWEITVRWMSLDLTDDQLTLVLVMAWCHQASSHYPGQCWPRSMLPCGITKPQWVKEARYKIIQNDGFSWKKSLAIILLW